MAAVRSPRTMTIEEVAAELGISRGTAYEEARSGNIAGIPVLRIGRRLIVPKSAVDRVLEGIEVQHESPDVA